jgi:hypothetical protein
MKIITKLIKWTFISFGVLFSLLVLAAIHDSAADAKATANTNAAATVAAPPPPVSVTTIPEPLAVVTADLLCVAYDRNAIAAEETYGKKRITVIGRIDSIGVAVGGYHYVSLKAGNTLTGIQCLFSAEDRPKLMEYSKGMKVAITGTMQFGRIMGHMLKDCSFADLEPETRTAKQ